MKKVLVKGAVFLSVLLAPVNVDAKGTARVEFYGDNNITVGDTFTVRMGVSDIQDTYDGVVSFGGNLSFDDNVLEYVSSKGVETPYLFQINESANYKIAGLDFTLDNGIKNDLTVYEFTFRAKEAGNTTITFENAKLTDSQDYIDAAVLGRNIIVEKEKEEVAENNSVTEEAIIEEKNINETVAAEKEQNKKQTVTREETEEVVEDATEDVVPEVIEVEEKIEVKKSNETVIDKIAKMLENLFSGIRKLFK